MQSKECLYYFWYSGYSRYLVTIWYLLRTLGSSTFTMGSSLSLPQACPQMCNSEQVEGLKIWGWGQTLLVEQTANVLWLKSVVLARLVWKQMRAFSDCLSVFMMWNFLFLLPLALFLLVSSSQLFKVLWMKTLPYITQIMILWTKKVSFDDLTAKY